MLPAPRVMANSPETEADYLIRITQFVTWSPQFFSTMASPLEICIFGNAQFQNLFEKIAVGRQVESRAIVVRQEANIYKLNTCHVIYIDESQEQQLTRILTILKNRSVLTVSTIPNFIDSGGTIGFTYQNNKLLFEINQLVAKMKGLPISSKLLRQSVRVIDK
ncbi:YfiR family protein [Beggiatoa leptomitoformis]|nr:YfiR family protein [Beggiatoa leptomitoformis]